MRLKTIQPVDFDTWIAQVKKFTSGNTQILNTNFPINTTENGVAEICVNIDKPLHEGFNATISYIQHYFETQTITNNGVSEDLAQPRSIEVVRYKKVLSYEDTNNLMLAMASQIPPEVVGLDRHKETIIQGVLNDAVANNTFNGLTATDYEIIVN